jgi:hypothetical protein
MGAKQRRQLARARNELKRTNSHLRFLEQDAMRETSRLIVELQQLKSEREKLTNNEPVTRLRDGNHEFLFEIRINRFSLLQMDDIRRAMVVQKFADQLLALMNSTVPPLPQGLPRSHT